MIATAVFERTSTSGFVVGVVIVGVVVVGGSTTKYR